MNTEIPEKAFILSAGLGTRLRPMGIALPKVMMPIGGKPLLQHHIELCVHQGIREFVINLHYLPEKITSYFGDGAQFGAKIRYSHEKTLLGTAGAIKKAEPELKFGTFLVLYGDNLLEIDLEPILRFHRERASAATIVLFRSDEPWTGGVVEIDRDSRILQFREKPPKSEIRSNLTNAGIYVFEPEVLDFIPSDKFFDFGVDLFPRLIKEGKELYGIEPIAYIKDIGTKERLEQAQLDFQTGITKIL